MTAQVLHGVHW
uniref:Uncharacterized protein n=1 Tax=Arundo donax TaxID=35708 RepID=A0A0A8ZS67_ARUDO